MHDPLVSLYKFAIKAFLAIVFQEIHNKNNLLKIEEADPSCLCKVLIISANKILTDSEKASKTLLTTTVSISVIFSKLTYFAFQ